MAYQRVRNDRIEDSVPIIETVRITHAKFDDSSEPCLLGKVRCRSG